MIYGILYYEYKPNKYYFDIIKTFIKYGLILSVNFY